MSRIDELIASKAPGGVAFRLLKEVAVYSTGAQLNRSALSVTGPYPVINGGVSPSGYFDEWNTEGDVITVSQGGASAGYVAWLSSSFWAGAHCYVVRPKDGLLGRFLYYVLKSQQESIQKLAQGAGIPGLGRARLGTVQVPVPPLEVQAELVRILDHFTDLEAELEAELEARRRQYEHYRSEAFAFGNDVVSRPLGDLATNLDSRRRPVTKDARVSGEIPYYGASGVVDYVSDFIFEGDYLLVSEDGANLLARSTPIAFSISGRTWVNNHAHVLEFDTYEERRFVELYLNSIDLAPYVSGAAQPKLNKANLNRIPIPDPPLAEKKRVVALLDKFDALVNDLSIGLPAELEARRKQYEYYRDKLLTFEEVVA